MKRIIKILLVILIVAMLYPTSAKACVGAPLVNIAIRLPSKVTIYDPIKGKSKGAKTENAKVRNGKIIFKNARPAPLKKQFRNILPDGAKITVYRNKDRIRKVVYAERGYDGSD